MLDIILLASGGMVLGYFTGLVPGIHPNTMAGFLMVFSPALISVFTIEATIAFMVSMAISHTFLSFIPSVYLGAPEGETALSILPGHKMLLEGRGYEAIYLTALGGLGVVLMSAALLPALIIGLPILYFSIRTYIGFILLGVAAIMISTEKNKPAGIVVFLASGLLGILVFSPAFSSQAILFPVFTGLYGISTLIISLSSGMKVPKQENSASSSAKNTLSGVTKGFLSGLTVGLLPGLGASQAAILVHQTTRGKSLKEFMIALGGINTVASLFSILSLFLISRPRSGISVAIQKLAGTLNFSDIVTVVAVTIFSAGLSCAAALATARKFSGLATRINYSLLLKSVIIFLIIMTVVLTGPLGVLVLVTSTSIGMLPPLLGVKRTHGMAVIMLPVIMFYLSFP